VPTEKSVHSADKIHDERQNGVTNKILARPKVETDYER